MQLRRRHLQDWRNSVSQPKTDEYCHSVSKKGALVTRRIALQLPASGDVNWDQVDFWQYCPACWQRCSSLKVVGKWCWRLRIPRLAEGSRQYLSLRLHAHLRSHWDNSLRRLWSHMLVHDLSANMQGAGGQCFAAAAAAVVAAVIRAASSYVAAAQLTAHHAVVYMRNGTRAAQAHCSVTT
jgi:hypothetical protein